MDNSTSCRSRRTRSPSGSALLTTCSYGTSSCFLRLPSAATRDRVPPVRATAHQSMHGQGRAGGVQQGEGALGLALTGMLDLSTCTGEAASLTSRMSDTLLIS